MTEEKGEVEFVIVCRVGLYPEISVRPLPKIFTSV